jgi:hypothetical protein
MTNVRLLRQLETISHAARYCQLLQSTIVSPIGFRCICSKSAAGFLQKLYISRASLMPIVRSKLFLEFPRMHRKWGKFIVVIVAVRGPYRRRVEYEP